MLPDQKRSSGGNNFFSQFAFFLGPNRILVLGSNETKSALYPIDPRWEPSYRSSVMYLRGSHPGVEIGGKESQSSFLVPLALYIAFE